MNKATEELAKSFMTDPQVKGLAHLPFLTLSYLHFQRHLVATPVTALELAAYLGVELRVAENVLSYLEGQGIVRQFNAALPAYFLNRELSEINVAELLPMLAKFQDFTPATGVAAQGTTQADEKYRRLYSELASEILQLFGQQSVNELPI